MVAFVFGAYVYSLCPDVYLIDSGELAAVSYTLGVAHPTGYPLYTLISYFFARLPGEPIRNLNLLSAVFSVIATAVIFLIAYRITKNQWAAALTAALFAFSPTIWRTSITNEVYPLTGLFVVGVIYLLYRCDNDRIFYFVMYITGLALTNHIIFFSLALPAIIYLIVVYKPKPKLVLTGIVFLFMGLSLYLYIVARTIGGAEIAWGNAYNLQRLFWHLTGKQYQVWMFSLSPNEVAGNLVKGLHFLARDFLYVLVIPVILGFRLLYRQERGVFWLLLGVLVANVLYTINYSIPDIESYYIPSLAALVIAFAYGLQVLGKYLRPAVVLPVALAVPIVNYNSCTLRHNSFGIDFGRSHVEQLPDSSLFITTHWDVYSPLMYLREVKAWRTDLVVIDKELLRRTWYIRYLEREYPEFYDRVRPSFEAYLEELYKFEYNRPYTAYVIQSRFIRMLERFVETGSEAGVYLATPWPDRDLNTVKPSYGRFPFGLVYRLSRVDTPEVYDFSTLDLRKPPVINDSRLRLNLDIVRTMLVNNVKYLTTAGEMEAAARVQELWESF